MKIYIERRTAIDAAKCVVLLITIFGIFALIWWLAGTWKAPCIVYGAILWVHLIYWAMEET